MKQQLTVFLQRSCLNGSQLEQLVVSKVKQPEDPKLLVGSDETNKTRQNMLIMKLSDVHRCLQVFTDVCRCLQVFTDVQVYF